LHVVWRDITERKALEEELRQSHKMEAVGKLAGGIAHDFNNLLLIIKGHAELLELQKIEPAAERHIKAIQGATDRAAALVSQLLAFSRKQQLLAIIQDCNQIVSGIADFIKRLIGEDIILDINLSQEDLPVKVDGGQIEQVLLNLAINARQAMLRGGRLCISVMRSDFALKGNLAGTEACALISVHDTGPGMDAQTADRAFEPFFTTKKAGEGTGLGLATVYGIVRQSGGQILLETAPDQGACFRIYLPLTVEKIVHPPEHKSLPEKMHRGTASIMVVEDEDGVAGVIVAALKKAGYEIRRARNGREGLQVFQAHPDRIHLIISDVIMPEMSGPAMLEELQKLGYKIPVLFISGYTDDALTELHGRADMRLLRKPFAIADLLQHVQAILES
jgi:nitrogen-specific signal transduction histidine kinase